jgi:hypothetical protein
MMLWEKKIQLAKETAAALDPNIGASEIRDMTSEIHRMKLRHASMLKIQEKMITEMEASVHRRESISMRTRTKGSGGGQLALHKQIADLGKKIKQTAYDVQECDKGILILPNPRHPFLPISTRTTRQCTIHRIILRHLTLRHPVIPLSIT